MQGVSFEVGNCGEDGGLAKEVFIHGELDNRWCFAFSNRPSNLLSIKLNKEILVQVDWQWVLYAY